MNPQIRRYVSSDVVDPVTLTYFKRYRMEIDLAEVPAQPISPPSSYRFTAWRPDLVEAHATSKFESFRWEIDANVFPCLGDPEGCRRLMTEISHRDGFIPAATWLAEFEDEASGMMVPVGTVQGVVDRSGLGSIQNLGIVPAHRGVGLGGSLLLKALQGFYDYGLQYAFLEVTAQNEGAIRLYERLGFRISRTVYKAVEAACS
ncbi:GNAT family N-acetyltransferase [Blastopirellula sp. JC732]|uniref:GNAT family N-acetyltransferase n=1 Tax=Blastopirellula sediminis TaxID=2894196 RepID=A0A9X1SGA3_9BACT|nr:GNAT family N-acetyltransferase [Blastopirellula sediminis]MCC9608757.1 GNAT family N-acetyltransferase [Blastopirellula sediminis]MCC9628466.1 GNAT family N-acetyltransferase [Blastopirellula sediminis]